MSYCGLEEQAKKNYFYRVVFPKQTSNQIHQIALQSLLKGEFIPGEIHEETTQIFHIVSGSLIIEVEGVRNELSESCHFIVEPGKYHKVYNLGNDDAKFWTSYTHQEHPYGLTQARQPSSIQIRTKKNGIKYGLILKRNGYVLSDDSDKTLCEKHIYQNVNEIRRYMTDKDKLECPACNQ